MSFLLFNRLIPEEKNISPKIAKAQGLKPIFSDPKIPRIPVTREPPPRMVIIRAKILIKKVVLVVIFFTLHFFYEVHRDCIRQSKCRKKD